MCKTTFKHVMTPWPPLRTVFTPVWMMWTGFMPTWIELWLILPLNSPAHALMEHAHPPTWRWWWKLIWTAISGAFCQSHVCAALRSTWGSIDVSWNWWPKKWRSNQLIAFQLIIVFQYCFIYNSARLQPNIHTSPSVEAYGPVNHGARLSSVCEDLFLGSDLSLAEWCSTNIRTQWVSSVSLWKQMCSLCMHVNSRAFIQIVY